MGLPDGRPHDSLWEFIPTAGTGPVVFDRDGVPHLGAWMGGHGDGHTLGAHDGVAVVALTVDVVRPHLSAVPGRDAQKPASLGDPEWVMPVAQRLIQFGRAPERRDGVGVDVC